MTKRSDVQDVNQKQVDSANEHLKEESHQVQPVGDLTTENYEWLEVQHGPTVDGDYVWHFSNNHAQRRIPDDQKKTIEIIATYLSKVIPDHIVVDCYPSPQDWEKKVITVKANGITKEWNFFEEDMKKYLPKIGELVSKEIENNVERRKFL